LKTITQPGGGFFMQNANEKYYTEAKEMTKYQDIAKVV